ncbi:MAG: sigma-70 family RNA polymerase sigma factor [Oscillospiraceae bacterium]|nr:sigma-70 family RNA polymerase sigma factor [Oscillospiraceae bacterium]
MDNMNGTPEINVNNSFYDKYNPQIRAIVARILNNANQTGDIDDCVNTVYLELMENLQQYNETRGSMAAFVTIIARSTALDYCRSNMRKPVELIGDDKIDFLSNPIESGSGSGFEDKVEFEMLVESILKKLNKEERVLFTMKHILFYSPEEIAKAMKIRRSAVDMRASRLKSKIKHFLIKGGITV